VITGSKEACEKAAQRINQITGGSQETACKLQGRNGSGNGPVQVLGTDVSNVQCPVVPAQSAASASTSKQSTISAHPHNNTQQQQSSTAGFTSLELISECIVCKADEHPPKLLDCGHTLCLQCVQELISRKNVGQSLRKLSKRSITCPTCMKSVNIPATGAATLPTNYAVLQLRESLQDMRNKTHNKPTIDCEVCDSKLTGIKANNYCKDCKEHLCNQCLTKHNVKKMYAKHSVCPTLLCEKHIRQIIYFCKSCGKTVCNGCLLNGSCEEHEDSIVDINEQLKDTENELDTVKAKCAEVTYQYNMGLKEFSVKGKQALNEIDSIKTSVEVHLCDVICRVKSRRDVITNQLESKHEEIKKVVVLSETCNEYLKQIQDSITAMESKGVEEQVSSLPSLKELLSTIEGLLSDELVNKDIEIPKFEAQETLAFGELVYKGEVIVNVNLKNQ